MLARSRKRRLVEGIVATTLLGVILVVIATANNFFFPAHVTLPAPQPLPTVDQRAYDLAAQYRMAAAASPAVAAQLRAQGIDPATGYPIKK